MTRHFRLFAALVSAWVAAAGRAGAQDDRMPRVIPCPPPCARDTRCVAPVRCPVLDMGAQRTVSHVRATMDGRVIRYEIEDRYVNRGGRPAEVDYALPLPKGAAFDNLELSINGEMIAGETMGADRARGVYEEIVRKLRDPALVEWMGHDLLRTRIFPIQPGEEKRVVVRFTAVAQRESDAIRVDWPARAVPGALTSDDWFELQYGTTGSDALGDAYSPTHNLSMPSRSNVSRTVRAGGSDRAMTILIPARRPTTATLTLLPFAPSGEDGYALITVTPPARLTHQTPRDLTFVVDVSGSMSGQKIEQARAAGRQFLGSLTPQDRFRLISFSTDVNEWRGGWTLATGDNVRAATTFINDLRAGGSTNIDGAVTTALTAQSPTDRLPLVLVITDGAPTVGETNPQRIARHAGELRGRARLFTFGLGADVNAALLEQLSLEGHGTAAFLRPDESVEREVSVVAERLTSPVATDVTIRLDGARLYALQPQGQIDLFAGQDLVALARYSGHAENATLTVEGHGPDGRVSWTQRVRLPERTNDNAFVGRLWAVQRVGWLSAERRRGGANAEIDDELRRLGERFGIPTELTSYLVVEPGMNAAQFRPVGRTDGPVGAGGARVPLSGVMTTATPAAAPAPSNDVQRFEAAKLSAEQRDIKSLGDTRQGSLNEKDAGTKVVAGHAFHLDSAGAWTEAKQKKAGRVVRVQAYSAAYFAILKELPDLAQLFAVGDKARFEGRAVAIELSPDSGETSLDSAAIASLVRDWK